MPEKDMDHILIDSSEGAQIFFGGIPGIAATSRVASALRYHGLIGNTAAFRVGPGATRKRHQYNDYNKY